MNSNRSYEGISGGNTDQDEKGGAKTCFFFSTDGEKKKES